MTILGSLILLRLPEARPGHYLEQSTSRIVQSIGKISVVGFILLLYGRPLAEFGLGKPRLVPFLVSLFGLAIVWVACQLGITAPLVGALWANGFRGLPWLGSAFSVGFGTNLFELSVAALSTLLAAFYEELAYRGLLTTRFAEISESKWIGVLVPGVFFSLAHLYQGIAAIPGHLIFGCATGWLFLKYRQVWALALAHFAVNFFLLVHLYLQYRP
ncbi:MAG: CPBP family intramembrane metalloprotease [Armatimonadetes bacterium]|nr:CPBP family intramembrane metalloprotease [Armatimonadota bacterium]